MGAHETVHADGTVTDGLGNFVGIDQPAAAALTRRARCFCGATRPSAPDLPFFEYCGEGSRDADRCVCGYAECAHDPDYMETLVHGKDGKRRPTVVEQGRCSGFRRRGGADHDRFYCGCRGWD